jgi:hypothetical protein
MNEEVFMGIGISLLRRSLALLAIALLAGCTVSTHEDNNKEAKDVDIRTPLGSLSVHKGPVDPKETGLAGYPGAEPKQSKDDDDSSANVNISSSLFGMKLAVLKYQTSDPPDKVLSFYRKEMSRYGKVLDCTGGFNMSFRRHEKDSEVTCEDHGGSNHSYRQELKVGTENNQRIVAVKPNGKGTEFVMVYVRAHDEKDTM